MTELPVRPTERQAIEFAVKRGDRRGTLHAGTISRLCWHVAQDQPGMALAKESDPEEEDYGRMCRNERAMELGMGLGINAYNDAMGY